MRALRLLALVTFVAWIAGDAPAPRGSPSGDSLEQHNPCNPKIRKC